MGSNTICAWHQSLIYSFMKQKLLRLHQDSLFRNSFYLMLSTGIMAGLGFLFWLITARLYSATQIGVATTLISAMSLISYLSLLGFNSTFIRFLPGATDRNRQINTGLWLALGAALVTSGAYVLIAPIWAPKLAFLTATPAYAIGFMILSALAALNLLTDSIFIALRAAKYNLLIDGVIMSSVKLALPLAFLSLGTYGIFLAFGTAAMVAMIMSILFLSLRFGYLPKLQIHRPTLARVFRYSFLNYLADLLNIAPTLVLPLIILSRLGAADAAYFYLAFMIANLVYTIAYAVSQSLFAEGSYADRPLRVLLKRSGLALVALMVPCALVLYLTAGWLLTIYGHGYRAGALGLLQILALAAPAVTINIMSGVLLRIHKQIGALLASHVVYCLAICGLALLWVHSGLVWIGYAWLAGQFAAAGVGFGWLLWHGRTHSARGGITTQAIT